MRKERRKVIEVKNLEKTYKGKKTEVKAVDDVSFSVYENEILGLLGPNGSGKTTTINVILGFLKYEKGEVLVFGEELKADSNEIKAKIGFVGQEVAVFEDLNVYENIDYFCGLYIKDKQTRKEYIDDVLKFTGLEKFVKFKPKKLSGGLLRRLHIACGIAHKPSLIFLDEPTVGIDPQSRNHILEGIKTLRNNGATIVYTSHYIEEIEELCDYIIILDLGKVVAEGTNKELKDLITLGDTVKLKADLPEKVLQEIPKLDKYISHEYHEQSLEVVFYKGNNPVSLIIDLLDKNNIKYSQLQSIAPTLNDVFLEITGKDLKD